MYLAIDVGGTFIKYALMNSDCEILERGKTETPMEGLSEFIERIGRIYDDFQEETDGIALSMPGIIDSKTGFMYTGGNLMYITDINIVELLQKRCPVPITVENDAKCAGLAEVWKGSLKDCKNAVVLVCGTSIGGAIIRDGRVLRGKHFMAGEFSYIATNTKDFYNLDNLVGYHSGNKHLHQIASEKLRIPAYELNGEIIFHKANCGDIKAQEAIEEFCHHLAIVINNLQFILDPEMFAIGGGISVQPLFLQYLRRELLKLNQFYPWQFPHPEITNCKFYNDSNLIGALYVHVKSLETKIRFNKIEEFIKNCPKKEISHNFLLQNRN